MVTNGNNGNFEILDITSSRTTFHSMDHIINLMLATKIVFKKAFFQEVYFFDSLYGFPVKRTIIQKSMLTYFN